MSDSILDRINSPQDLKTLSLPELKTLAAEIRGLIVETTLKNGGHMAPSLGAVDLTIALHRVFNAPEDKIVWDVGHQSYAHKIITGRRNAFGTLRTYGGLSGFPSREESEYDTFTVGHSSTAISSALGLAAARDLKGEDYKVIAVVGDGSMTGGLAFEGLENAGHLGSDLLVVLNDNEMFISHQVGSFASYLAKLLTAGTYKKFEKSVEKFFKRLHFWGAQILRVAKRFKVLLFPGMLFEELGFAYLGPVDGHDIKALTEIFENIKNMKGPILVHVVTKKGKGYAPAESNPTKYHGIPPLEKNDNHVSCEKNIVNNQPDVHHNNNSEDLPPELTYTQVFGEAMREIAASDEKVLAITAAMSEGTGLAEFAREFKGRFFDVGIAEQHAVTFSAGLAAGGYKPVCAIYSTFLQRALDQMIHDVALNRLPVVFAVDRAGLVGEDGATHHGAFDISYTRAIPRLVICAPSDGNELRDLLYSALTLKWGERPVLIRYPRGGCGLKETGKGFNYVECGTSRVLSDAEGKDVVIFSVGDCTRTIYQNVLPLLKAEKGISAGLIDIRFVKPLDEKTILDSLREGQPAVVVEENVSCGGAGEAIADLILSSGIKTKVMRISLPDEFVPHGSQKYLRELVGLSAGKIAQSIDKFLFPR